VLTEAQQTMLLDNEANVLLNQLTSITEAVAKFDATQVPSTTTNDGDNSNETPVTTPREPEKMSADTCQMIREELSK
jgi:hypothetical protein